MIRVPDDNAKVTILDVYSEKDTEIWWDQEINTACSLKHLNLNRTSYFGEKTRENVL